jgi:hypothetical protein
MFALNTAPVSETGKNQATGFKYLPSKIAVFELVLFLGVFCGAQYLTTGSVTALEMSPHPFWIPVLLLSVQYGTVEGLCAVLISGVVMWMSGLPEQTPDEEFNNYVLRVAAEPAMWGLAAIVFGFLRDRQKEELNSLQQILAETYKQRDLISAHCDKLRRRNRTLQRHIARTRSWSIPAAYEAVQKVRSIPVEEISQPLTTCMDMLIGADKFSVFTLSERCLRLVLHKGWITEDEWRTDFYPEDRLYEAMLLEKRALSRNRARDVLTLQRQGIFAFPLVCSMTGGVIGMLKVEAISQHEITSETEPNLRFLTEHIAHSIAQFGERAASPPEIGSKTNPYVIAGPQSQSIRRVTVNQEI